jgi:hypothetical protein
MSAIRHRFPDSQHYVIHQKKVQDEELTIQVAGKVAGKGIRTLPTSRAGTCAGPRKSISWLLVTNPSRLGDQPIAGASLRHLLGSSALVHPEGLKLAAFPLSCAACFVMQNHPTRPNWVDRFDNVDDSESAQAIDLYDICLWNEGFTV